MSTCLRDRPVSARRIVMRGRFLEFWADAQKSLKPMNVPCDSILTESPTCLVHMFRQHARRNTAIGIGHTEHSMAHFYGHRKVDLAEHSIASRLASSAGAVHVDLMAHKGLEHKIRIHLLPQPPLRRSGSFLCACQILLDTEFCRTLGECGRIPRCIMRRGLLLRSECEPAVKPAFPRLHFRRENPVNSHAFCKL